MTRRSTLAENFAPGLALILRPVLEKSGYKWRSFAGLRAHASRVGQTAGVVALQYQGRPTLLVLAYWHERGVLCLGLFEEVEPADSTYHPKLSLLSEDVTLRHGPKVEVKFSLPQPLCIEC